MDETAPADAKPECASGSLPERLSGYVASALRYWEPRRLIYNGVLGAIVLAHVFIDWPNLRGHVSLDGVLGVFFFAVLANVCYCTAYVVDVFVQFSGLRQALRVGRAMLFVVGTAFAGTITHFISKGFRGP